MKKFFLYVIARMRGNQIIQSARFKVLGGQNEHIIVNLGR